MCLLFHDCKHKYLSFTCSAGSYAIVRYAQNVDSKETVAMKIIDKSKIQDPVMLEQLKREIAIMKKVSHPNLVRLIEGEGDLSIKSVNERMRVHGNAAEAHEVTS